MRAGFGIAALALFGNGVASSGWQLYALAVFDGLDAIFLPAVKIALASLAPSRPGVVQGLISNLETLAMVLIPLLVTNTYRLSAKWRPDFTYLLLSGLATAGMLASCCLRTSPNEAHARAAALPAVTPIVHVHRKAAVEEGTAASPSSNAALG